MGMKGLILSGGKGTRLRPLTYTRAKQLLPLANKPVLFLAIESLVDGGIRDLGIVVGDTAQEVERGGGRRLALGPRGAYPVHPARRPRWAWRTPCSPREEFLGDDKFIMFLGDNLIGEPLDAIVGAFSAPDCDYHCRILLKPMENPSEFGVAELREGPRGRRADDQASDREAARATEQPRARRRLLLRSPHLRGRARHQALRPRRIGDHRRDPVADR